jgi:HKD family nuclease
MQLVSNSSRKNHRAEIVRQILSSNTIILCSGWLKLDGLKLLLPALDRTLRRPVTSIRVYTNAEHTEDEAIKELEMRQIEHICVSKVAFYFHSKFYYFERGSFFTAVVGSANITYGGLVRNEEVSTIHSGAIASPAHLAVKKYLDHLSARLI